MRFRWCLRERQSNLTDHQQGRCRDRIRYNLRTDRAYLLKTLFTYPPRRRVLCTLERTNGQLAQSIQGLGR